MTAFPFRPSDAKSLAEQRENPIQFNVIKDFADGFASENLPTMAIDYLLNKQDFPEDKTYNPKNDPQLKTSKPTNQRFGNNQLTKTTVTNQIR